MIRNPTLLNLHRYTIYYYHVRSYQQNSGNHKIDENLRFDSFNDVARNDSG